MLGVFPSSDESFRGPRVCLTLALPARAVWACGASQIRFIMFIVMGLYYFFYNYLIF